MKIIKVTKEDIKNGVPNSCKRCPVALALAFNHAGLHGDSMISGWALRVDGRCYHCPRSVVRFINRFDQGKPVKPFSFKLVEEA